MRFEELYERRQRRALTMVEAAEILGVTERTFRDSSSGVSNCLKNQVG